MLEITTKSGEVLQVNEDNIFAMKPEPSGITRVYFTEQIPNPERKQRPSFQLRITESPESLDIYLEKFEEPQDGSYIYLNMEQVLAKTPTEQGFRAFLPGNIGSNTPFPKKTIELQEVG